MARLLSTFIIISTLEYLCVSFIMAEFLNLFDVFDWTNEDRGLLMVVIVFNLFFAKLIFGEDE